MDKIMKSYAITDPKYYTNNPAQFQKRLQNVIDNNAIDMICFRDKISTNQEELIGVFLDTCKTNLIERTFINTNIELAHKYNAYGVHLTSKQFKDIPQAKDLALKTIISCHNTQEIEKAISFGIDYITYSPIFTTPNKGEPKGIDNLAKTIQQYPSLPIIALGGIVTKEHLLKIQSAKPFGFASIRYFINK
jgi:thiamine-phosphate pyrophosphorylase